MPASLADATTAIACRAAGWKSVRTVRLPRFRRPSLSSLLAEGLVGFTLTRTTPLPYESGATFPPFAVTYADGSCLLDGGKGGRDAAPTRMSISEAVLRDCSRRSTEKLAARPDEQFGGGPPRHAALSLIVLKFRAVAPAPNICRQPVPR